MRAFLEALAEFVPDDERVLISSVPGDPAESAGEMWNVRPWRWGDKEPPANMNNYVCVSSFRRGPRGWRRTADQFGRALAFMVDDVGTKVARDVVSVMTPSAIIETSPGNEQYWYLFNAQGLTDYETFSALVSAFVQQRCHGRDPGMGGANRVGRLPLGINGKAKYRSPDGEPFHCKALHFDARRRYSLRELLEGFTLTLTPPRPRGATGAVSAKEREQRLAEFEELRADCETLNLVLKRRANHAGRIPIVCPWYQKHSDASKSGTYLVEPNERNNWRGSFVCFHSTTHADDNHLKDIKQWVSNVMDRFHSALVHHVNLNPPPHDVIADAQDLRVTD